jgi:adenylate cyclase
LGINTKIISDSIERFVFDNGAALPFPDKPSIAVLPLDNMSRDPDQQYFSDGITEDIITALSRSPWLFVISCNSSFTYRGKIVDIKQVARELGARYILEGSVRKAGKRIRVTAQLINGSVGSHVWAEKYDGELQDIFDLQDQITQQVVASLLLLH